MARFPLRARRRPPRKGLSYSLAVVGGSYVPPVEYTDSATVYLNLQVVELAPYFPTTQLLDDFNRANESPLAGNWSTPITAVGFGAQARLTSNAIITHNTPPANVGAYWDIATFGPDCEAWMRCAADLNSGESWYVYARIKDEATTNYDAYQVSLNFAGTLAITRRDNGAGTLLSSSTVTATVGDYIGIRCIGSLIEAWHKPVSTGEWVRVTTAEDNTYPAAGYIGFGMLTNDTTTILDDFGGGTYVPATEHAQFVESTTVNLTLTPSGTEFREGTDTAEIYLDLQAISTAEEHTTYDTAEVYVDLQASGSDQAEYIESSTVYFDLDASGTDIAEFVDAQTVGLLLTPSGTDTFQAIDVAEVYLDLTASGVEELVREFLDSAEIYVDLQASGTELAEYVEAQEVYLELTVSSADAAEFTDSSTVYLDLLSSGTDTIDHSDDATIPLDIEASGTELLEAVETNEVYFDLEASGTESQEGPGAQEYIDADTVYLDLQATSVDFSDYIDSETVLLNLETSGIDEAPYVDADTVYLDMEGTGVEESATDTTDEDTVYLDLGIISTESAEFIDLATVLLSLLPSGTDIFDIVDSATVYLDIQPGAIFLQVDCILEILGCMVRFKLEAPFTQFSLGTLLARWTILERKRYLWRS